MCHAPVRHAREEREEHPGRAGVPERVPDAHVLALHGRDQRAERQAREQEERELSAAGHGRMLPVESPVMTTREQKAAAFEALHAGEAFVIPNPWDVGSAKLLAGLGFQALATTSSGFAFTLGRADGGATLD